MSGWKGHGGQVEPERAGDWGILMHGLPSFLLMMLVLPAVPAFLLRLFVSWRSYVVGATAAAAVVVLAALASLEIIIEQPAWLQVYGLGFFLAAIGGTIGSGLAKLVTAVADRSER